MLWLGLLHFLKYPALHHRGCKHVVCGFSKPVGCRLLMIIAWDICALGLAGSRCTTLAAMPCPVHFYFYLPEPVHMCLSCTGHLVDWESEIHSCLGKTDLTCPLPSSALRSELRTPPVLARRSFPLPRPSSPAPHRQPHNSDLFHS